jgi:hypothetical protein
MKHPIKRSTPLFRRAEESGQSLVEYALIIVLVVLAFGFALAATGPAISRIFSNTVYNLLGEAPDKVRTEGKEPIDFWLTVTWVAQNPLEERLIPTPTRVPPSLVPPADLLSRTPTPITPTPTIAPTRTPVPSPTPEDVEFPYPYSNSANNTQLTDMRLSNAPFLGYADWYGKYYTGRSFGESNLAFQGYNEEIYGVAAKGILDLPNAGYANWTNQNSSPRSGWPTTSPNDNFSVKFTRDIYVETTQTLRFFVNSDDGVRVWIIPSGQSADSCATGTGTPNVVSGQVNSGYNLFYGDGSAFPTGCLLVDDWHDQGFGGGGTVIRTVPAGTYTLQVDLYEAGGGAGVQLFITAMDNPYDTAVDNSGVPVPGAVNCNWGAKTTSDSNTLMNMWEEYVGGNIPNNMRCYLELRGFITVPASAPAPRITFWDVWDLNHSSFSGWIEVAEYVPIVSTSYAIDRAATVWYRIPIRQGASINYNWTYTEIPLDNVQAFAPNGTATTLDFRDKRLTFRFVIQSSSTSGNTRRWYVDDIQVKNDLPAKNVTLGFGGDEATNSVFKFNNSTDRDYFITTGQWDLTSNNVVTDPDTVGNPTSCCSWELNPGVNYNRFSESDGGSTATNQSRIHYIELVAPVSQSLYTVDDEGDLGVPMLSFMSGYYVGSYTNIEVQYRPVGSTTWTVVPGDNLLNPGRPAGELHTGITSGSPSPDRRALTPVDIELGEIKDGGGIPIDTFYLRFAVIVRSNTDAQNTGNTRPGWWIDDIRLHRKGIERFIDYPFYDGAETGIENWLPSGQWWRVNDTKYQGGHAFTDTPSGSYANNTNFTLRLIKAIDFRNDTPDNLAAFDRNSAGGNSDRDLSDGNPLATPAINPVFSFWHLRRLTSGDNLHLEWRNANETEGDWKRAWSYVTRMTNDPNTLRDKTRYNDVWEYVEVDLRPIVATFTANTKSDDILFRFRLFADGSNSDDGIYIDEINIQDGSENVFRLWADGTNPSINGVQFGNGSGANWASDADENDWFTKWRTGGEWTRVDWEQRNGLNSFHESATDQTAAPYLTTDSVNTTKIRSYQVLEMTQIIDMRAADRTTRPTLYFWSRYRTADDDRLTVQISYELRASDYSPSTLDQHMTARCRNSGVTQCYEQLYGWSPWTEQATPANPSPNWSSTMTFNIGQYQNSFGWRLYQVDLSEYAATVTAPQLQGRRIRIRFVYDALENGGSTTKSKYDGWYLDDLRIVPRYDQVTVADIENDVFYDGATNLNNWITEGNWGLDPEITASGGATVATLGIWREYWWDCRNCRNLAPGGTPSNQEMLVATDIFLDNTNPTTHAVSLPVIGSPQPRVPVQRSVLDINYRMGSGTPRPGTTSYTNDFVGRWVLNTPVVGPSSGIAPGQYTFITVSDNGVRMKIDEVDGSGNILDPRPPALEWNVINNWSDHGEVTDMGRVTLQSGRQYRIVMEYYERSGSATITLSLGGSTFSFTDSPKQGAGVGFPDIPALPNADTSLILNGVLDLQGTTQPILEYYTLYELSGASSAVVEVSTDGGFTWRNNGLGDDIELIPGGCGSGSNSSTCAYYDGPSFSGSTRVPGSTWQLRRHNLTNYEGQLVMIRFRLDRDTTECLSSDNTCTVGGWNYNANNWFISWWIVDITVAKTS